jgi:uncharacterized repeat protein (TIGR01451 family)
MITKTKTYLIPGLVYIFLLLFANNKVHSQYTGLNIFFNNADTLNNVNTCIHDSTTGYLYWEQPGVYVTGDYMDLNIDWGDGNQSPFIGIPIDSFPGYGYVTYFPFDHVYSAPGNYIVILSAIDNHSNADIDTFNVNIGHSCGNLFASFYMDNGDGILGPSDIPLTGVDVELISNNSSYYSSSSLGYTTITNIDLNEPAYVFQIDSTWLASSGMTLLNPIGGSYNVITANGNSQYFPFLFDCDPSIFYDAGIYAFSSGFYAPFGTGSAVLSVDNNTCGSPSATKDISFDFDPLLTVFSASIPGGTITSGNISWTNVNVPFGHSEIRVQFTFPTSTPAWTLFALHAEIIPSAGTPADTYPINDSCSFIGYVWNSFDPNFKSTNVGALINVNIQEEILYTVHFQNLGNSYANNIHIVDTISSLLDLSTLKVVGQSHAGSYSIDPSTREVIFTFPNIFLVPQSTDEELSQGYIMYTVKENPGLPLNSEIENTAHIFFDGNSAVVTNTTSNVNVTNPAGVEDESALGSITVYPVPANTFVQISGINPQDITGLKILDLNGKVVQILNTTNANSNISVSEIANGFYLLEIISGMNSILKKICIQH